MTQTLNDDLASRARAVLEKVLGPPQPLSKDVSGGVEMRLGPRHRIGLALLILGVVPEGEEYYMTEGNSV